MAKRLDDVTERLEMMESFRAPGTRRSNVTFVDIPSDEHLEALEEDELMRTQDEIETRARAPRTVDPGPGRPKVRPTTFDGHSSWEDYLAQFNLVTELNRWDSVTKATYLAVSLSGPAREVLGDLTVSQRKDFTALTTALSMRFGTENRTEIYRASLRTRTRRKDESLPQLAQAIRRLTRCAYPQAPADMRRHRKRPFHRRPGGSRREMESQTGPTINAKSSPRGSGGVGGFTADKCESHTPNESYSDREWSHRPGPSKTTGRASRAAEDDPGTGQETTRGMFQLRCPGPFLP
ncbi:hypothetical protein QZH41_007419 [Actinostola sp. cb2023]|nr:hypothetical protein QZH41_007419 [Actinostola sp. cb2023]